MTPSACSYCESHDQALVGDKTLAFWLMDKEMYGAHFATHCCVVLHDAWRRRYKEVQDAPILDVAVVLRDESTPEKAPIVCVSFAV